MKNCRFIQCLTNERHLFMKDYQLKLFNTKNTTLKKRLSLIVLLLFLSNLNAQMPLRVEPGVLVLSNSDDFGLLLNLEPNIKISKSTIIGLRFGIALNSQKFEITDRSQFNIDNQQGNAVISFMPTFDYFLNQDKIQPYIGLGLGYYLFNKTDVFQIGSRDVLDGEVKNKLGILLRSGFESGNTRFGLEYNFVPKADIEIPDGQTIGTVRNSYLGLSIGFTIRAPTTVSL